MTEGTAATLPPTTGGGMDARRASVWLTPTNPPTAWIAAAGPQIAPQVDAATQVLSSRAAWHLLPFRLHQPPASQLRVPGGPASWSTGLCTALAVGHSCDCWQAARQCCPSTLASLILYCWRITHELAKLAAGWCGLRTETRRHKSSRSSRRCGGDTRKLQGCAHRRVQATVWRQLGRRVQPVLQHAIGPSAATKPAQSRRQLKPS